MVLEYIVESNEDTDSSIKSFASYKRQKKISSSLTNSKMLLNCSKSE